MNATTKKVTKTQEDSRLEEAEVLAMNFINAEGTEDPIARRNAYKVACSALASFSDATRVDRTEAVSEAINFAYGEQSRVKKLCQGPAAPTIAVTGPNEEITDPKVLKAIKSIRFRIKSMGSNSKLQFAIGKDMKNLGTERIGNKWVRTVDYYHTTLNTIWQEFLAAKANNNGEKLKAYPSMSEAEKSLINLEALESSVKNSLENLEKRVSQYGDLHSVK